MVAIYLTLGLAATLAGVLRDEGLISTAFWVGLLLVGAAVVTMAFETRPSGAEIGVVLGAAGAYLIAFLRMASPEERSHMIEYSVVAILIYAALLERRKNGKHVPVPAVLAIAITAALGWLDEIIQWFLPDRVYDNIDVLFNSLAALMAVAAMAALAWARRRSEPG